MNGITVCQVRRSEAMKFEEENIYGNILPVSPFSSASAGYIAPYSEQKKHFHTRPDNGVEIIFVYQGKFKMLTSEGESEVMDAGECPVFIQVESKCVASLKNVGNLEVRFFSVFAPGFDLNELTYVD
jgi:oxalate decarboxylase/phosphoglucose isomerase-like protein (cupin superfamily)